MPLSSPKPSILILYCGGTIGMRQNQETSALEPYFNVNDILGYTKDLDKQITMTTKTITNIDSTNMQPHHWTTIIDSIVEEYENYDGFVVVQGTDTMAYTASAISYAIGNLGKPIVLTGAQVPPDILGSDSTTNIIHACQVATMDFGEVTIVFGTKILRGNRSVKVSESERNAFISPIFPELGSIRLRPELTYIDIKHKHNSPLHIKNAFDGNVAVIKCVPGFSPSIIEKVVETGVDGLILESFGPGNVPNKENSLLPVIRTTIKKGIPVVITTQCIYGATRMYLYDVGQKAIKLGVIPSGDMTPEAAYVKLKWILAQTRELKEISRMFTENIAGETIIAIS